MTERHYSIVINILRKYPYTFYAFGSRAKGTSRKLSDLDICFKESIPLNVQQHIVEDFQESDLPFTVDLIDFQTCSQEFQEKINPSLILLN